MESEQDALHSKKESINTVELKAGDNGGGGSLYTNKLTDTPLYA